MIPQANGKVNDTAVIESEVNNISETNFQFKIDGDIDHVKSDNDKFMDDSFVI